MKWDERKDRLKILAFKAFVRALDYAGAHRVLAQICSRFVTEFSDGKHKKISDFNGYETQTTVLVLDFKRFRGDVEILAHEDSIRVLSISSGFLHYLLASFLRQPTIKEELALSKNGTSRRLEFGLARQGSVIFEQRQLYRSFLRKFLPPFFKKLGVDVVLNSDLRFRREVDIARIASELGYPHICYFREAMYIVPAIYDKGVIRYKKLAPFHGDVIAVQNEVVGAMLLESGMAAKNQIMVRGCPRMDALLSRLSISTETKKTKTRQIAFFSWPRHVPLQDGTKFNLFDTALDVVRTLIELAKGDPSLHIILKIKDQHMKGSGQGQIAGFKKVIRDVVGNEDGLPNVEFVTNRMGTHDVILSSDIICAMQSTVVLEAAIAGKPVVVPHFSSLIETSGADQTLMYSEYRKLFDVPTDAKHMKKLLLERLENPEIDVGLDEQRLAVFERYVSPFDGTATKTMLDLVWAHGNSGRKKRNAVSR